MPVLQYDFTRDIAKAFAKHLDSDKKEYSPRPFNRFKPKETVWWVIPGTEWPAYKYGKYIFIDDGENINCGINIEKGFGLEAQLGYSNLSKKGLIMESCWQWNNFKKDLEQKIVNNKINDINQTVIVEIGIIVASDPMDYDPNAPKPNKYVYLYDGKLKLVPKKSNMERFVELKDIKKLSEIPGVISEIEMIDWCWIDLNILLPFKKKKHGCSEELFDEYKLDNILNPLERWIY